MINARFKDKLPESINLLNNRIKPESTRVMKTGNITDQLRREHTYVVEKSNIASRDTLNVLHSLTHLLAAGSASERALIHTLWLYRHLTSQIKRLLDTFME